ncbi:MAG: class II fructose-bisphosphate aldolase [Deltaproteobacteria bacterium]|nr:class II fructose-bisphosphate aldolase [Deltaproteobacteria bacterium]
MICENLEQLKAAGQGVLSIQGDKVEVLDEGRLRNDLIDTLIFTAVFSPQAETAATARRLIRQAAAELGIYSASIQPLYEAMGRREVAGFTVPAINIRGLTYCVAQAVLRAALKENVGAVFFEIARSEIGYTLQRPAEYAAAVTAAAIKTGYRGPLFIQGDHFQIIAKRYLQDAAQEIKAVKDLIWEAIEAGFYNIDIDTSTLVDLTKPTISEQQRVNYRLAAELTTVIRDLEPAGMTVSVGGEIGEVGSKNSTVEELQAFMSGYLEELQKYDKGFKGISKISVQTGTTHGGVPLSDGTIAKVNLDFDTLEKLSREARDGFGLAGAVQHGASTLPDECFDKFPAIATAEIHLATGFQNMILDSKNFPSQLRERIYLDLQQAHGQEKKPGDTDEQFLYKNRKQSFGVFKKELWHLPEDTLRLLGGELEQQFSFLFQKLNMVNTCETVNRYVKPRHVTIAPA